VGIGEVGLSGEDFQTAERKSRNTTRFHQKFPRAESYLVQGTLCKAEDPTGEKYAHNTASILFETL